MTEEPANTKDPKAQTSNSDKPKPVERPPREGHYGILFVGIICFFKDTSESRLVLLPDGRDPGPAIEPHFPSIVADPAKLKSADGWSEQEKALGFFPLPKCVIRFSGAATSKDLRADQHEANIPKLTAINSRIRVDVSTPNAVVQTEITNGTLEAFRFPGTSDASPDAAVLSRLEVPLTGDVEIEIESDEWPKETRVRKIVLQPGTEIALQNMSIPQREGKAGSHVLVRPRSDRNVVLWNDERRLVAASLLRRTRGDQQPEASSTVEERDHFILYAKILRNVSGPLRPQNTPIHIPRLLSDHPVFLVGIPISSATNRCGNQGCC